MVLGRETIGDFFSERNAQFGTETLCALWHPGGRPQAMREHTPTHGPSEIRLASRGRKQVARAGQNVVWQAEGSVCGSGLSARNRISLDVNTKQVLNHLDVAAHQIAEEVFEVVGCAFSEIREALPHYVDIVGAALAHIGYRSPQQFFPVKYVVADAETLDHGVHSSSPGRGSDRVRAV